MTSLSDQKYVENPEQHNFPDLDLIVHRFKNGGRVKAREQVWMYESISRNWCIGKSVIDVGCGIGWGTNILSREAVGAFGVDANAESISFAKQFFGNTKLKFEVADITKPEPRPTATFDIVTFIEVIEHIQDYDAAINNLKRYYDPKRKTVFFISTPNRNNERLSKSTPNNKQHVREWTAGEFYEVLTKHFNHVVLYGINKHNWFEADLTVDGTSDISPIVAKCELPIFTGENL